MAAQEKNIRVNGKNMVYITFGEGTRNLVIIAGLSLGGIRGLGEGVAAAYDIFSRDCRVWLFDRVDEPAAGYTTADMAADIACALDALGIRNADVLGVSQGGMIAQLLAAKRPELIRSMVLCSSACHIGSMAQRVLSSWLALAEQRDIPGLNRCFFAALYTPEFCRENAAVLKCLENVGTPEQCGRFVILARAALEFDSRAVLGQICCPVLIIGDEDDAVLGAEASRELAQLLRCQSYLYRGYGHAVYDTAPDIKERMQDFFRSAISE